MNAKVEKLDKNVVKLEITVEAEKFNESLKKSYAKNVKRFNVPGFRKGKAPMNIIKKYYGVEVLFEDAINFCCEATYGEVIKENDIKPVDYPEIEIVDVAEGKDFVYSAKVTVYPEVELGEYKDLEVVKVEYPVLDEDVDSQLKMMQEKNARVEAKEEDAVVENGNIAIIDFKGFIDDVPFEGGEGKDYSLEIGSGTFIDTFEDQLVGLKVNEEKDVNVTFPEQYGKEELSGKAATFKVAIKEIKAKEIPALDDEFAKETSEFDTLEELKADTRKKIEESNNLKANREFEEKVIDVVCDNAKVEVPEIMVKNETDKMIKDLEVRLQYQGLDINTYYTYTNSSEEKVRECMKESAEKKVKAELVLSKIADTEGIEATEEELLEKTKEIAEMYGADELDEKVKLILDAQKENIKKDINKEKVIDMLVNNCKTTA